MSAARDQRAREDHRERVPAEPLAERLGLRPAGLGQREVGSARVLAAPRPLGFTVTGQPELALHRLRAGGAIRVAHAGRSSVSGRAVSSGVAMKNSRGRQPKIGASRRAGTCAIRVLYWKTWSL